MVTVWVNSTRIAAAYTGLFEREVHLQDAARQMQVKFKIQVQEWKDVPLRGYDPEALKKYSRAFVEDGNAVRDMAEVLTREAPDSKIRALAEEFTQAHAKLGDNYALALRAFSAANGVNPRDADGMVKGQDRAPTALVDRIVELLRQRTSR